MLEYAYGHDEIVANFVAQLIPECRTRGFGKCSAIGIVSGTQLVGGLVYRNWCPEMGTIEISGAALPGTNWLSRRTVNIMYNYPFYELGCQMVIKTTMADNAIVLRILSSIGFAFHYVKRLGGRDRDAVIATLTVEDWEASRYNVNRKRPDITEPLEEAA